MPKAKTVYTCNECGAASPKWVGQCPSCNAWNSLFETVLAAPAARGARPLNAPATVQRLDSLAPQAIARRASGLTELDRVLGGGLVAGSVVLIGGDPGIGKSTLLLQALSQVARPQVIVVDSIQTVFTEILQSAPGSVAQVRESAAQLVRFAKRTGTALFLVGHVTKEGALAGPRVLEHMVDTVLYFEGDTGTTFRVIRAIKNRFGAVNEIGVFVMTEAGLREVGNPSAMFLSRQGDAVAGSVVLATQEGTRPLLVEVQALVDENHSGNPRRVCVGLDPNRLAMLLPVQHRQQHRQPVG